MAISAAHTHSDRVVYCFDTLNGGELMPDESGTDLDGDPAARAMALKNLGDLAKDRVLHVIKGSVQIEGSVQIG